MPIGVLYHDRVCSRCGLAATPEGHDPCIANLPGVKFACCGHGVREGYIVFENDITIRFIPLEITKHSKPDYTKANRIWKLVFKWKP